MPEACVKELKVTQSRSTHTMLNSSVASVINLEKFSKLSKLLWVTVYELRFVKQCISRVKKDGTTFSNELSAAEILEAENMLVRESQRALIDHKNFSTWKTQFGLFLKGSVWRCKGRLSNANISNDKKYPALLCKEHHFTKLVVRDAQATME